MPERRSGNLRPVHPRQNLRPQTHLETQNQLAARTGKRTKNLRKNSTTTASVIDNILINHTVEKLISASTVTRISKYSQSRRSHGYARSSGTTYNATLPSQD